MIFLGSVKSSHLLCLTLNVLHNARSPSLPPFIPYYKLIIDLFGRTVLAEIYFTRQMVYLYGKVTVKQRLEGVYDVAANMFEDIETALGLEQDDEDSEIDFES